MIDCTLQEQSSDRLSEKCAKSRILIKQRFGTTCIGAKIKSYGEFIIDNDLNDNIAKIHDEFVLDMIDREALGLEQMQIDGGVFVDGNYIAAGVYDMTEEYQGEFKNDSEYLKTAHAFELEIAKSPSDDNSTEKTGEWITLPISKESANAIAKAHGEKSIEDCVYYGFKSAILIEHVSIFIRHFEPHFLQC